MKFTILFFSITMSLVFTKKNYADDGIASLLMQKYFGMSSEMEVDSIEEYFSDDYNSSLVMAMKKRCGYSCILGFSDRWEVFYLKYVREANSSRQEYKIVFHDIEMKNQQEYELVLARQKCNGVKSQEIVSFVLKGNDWKIKAVEFSEWSEAMESHVSDADLAELIKKCDKAI